MVHNRWIGGAFILVGSGLLFSVVLAMRPPATAPNPDPSHIHADVALWINGKQFDFAVQKYMTTEAMEAALPAEDPRKAIHFHEGNGQVVHIHLPASSSPGDDPGVTVGDFFRSLRMSLSKTCLIQDTGEKTCDAGPSAWRMFVNGMELPVMPDFALRDLDRILLTYGADDAEARRELTLLTDDACLYSQTCPRRGKPPAEGCGKDASVPCRL